VADYQIKPREEIWPFIWGTSNEPRVVILEHDRYLFPEHTAPEHAPDLQKLVDRGVDYAIDPEQLGVADVVMTGREFIDQLYLRHIDLSDIGEWSPKEAENRGTGRTLRTLKNAVARAQAKKAKSPSGHVYFIVNNIREFDHLVNLVRRHISTKIKVHSTSRIIQILGDDPDSDVRINVLSADSKMYEKETGRVYGERDADVFHDHTVIEAQYALNKPRFIPEGTITGRVPFNGGQ
jgi:hypothetical protein